jgi:hypothetical protein
MKVVGWLLLLDVGGCCNDYWRFWLKKGRKRGWKFLDEGLNRNGGSFGFY